MPDGALCRQLSLKCDLCGAFLEKNDYLSDGDTIACGSCLRNAQTREELMSTVVNCSACGKPVPPAEAAAYHGKHEDCWALSVDGDHRAPLAHKTDRRRKAPPLEPGAGLASLYSGVPVAYLEGLRQITNQGPRVTRRKH